MSAVPSRPESAPQGPALDQLMLTMDLVDSIRHEEALASAAMADAQTEQQLVEQVRRTYAAQGIDVSDQVIEDAVRALRERRFQYQAAPRGLQATLARAYVSRRRWGPLVAVLLAVMAAVGVAGNWIDARREATRIAEAGARADSAASDLDALAQQAGQLAHAAAALLDPAPPDAVAMIAREARDAAQDVRERAGAARARLSGAGRPERLEQLQDSAAETDAAARAASVLRQSLAGAAAGLDQAQRLLAAQRTAETQVEALQASDTPAVVERAGTLLAQVRRAVAAADVAAAEGGVAQIRTLGQQATQRAAVTLQDIPDPHRPAALRHVAAMDAALASGDAAAFTTAAAALEQLTTSLRQAYTLRIVNRQGVQSGVWRHPNDNRNARNYYIVVDAIGPDGRRLEIPVTNEETGQIVRTATFAVRVPEAVYEQVKADKLDNGLVDNAAFGEKRAGETEVRYAFPTAGGAITRW